MTTRKEKKTMSFGGLFKGIGDLIDMVSDLGEDAIEKQGEIEGLPKGMKGVYGFSIKTMGGKPVVETFGNIHHTKGGSVIEEVREPITDVFDEEDQIRVIIEAPGVSEEEMKIEINGDILNFSATGKDRKYLKEILLTGKVKPEPSKTSFKNGIMEIFLEKQKAE